ncbi:ATP-binding protein [Desulfitibacter alkalitolerans]|uniref:ATP-binding protein n=1 Tax=Desulfitibacter alkalitolerans TaxID=264641 RepID=UPI00047F05B3|nr:ATP-binding protein [Desulfitibacter alkalitolerans]
MISRSIILKQWVAIILLIMIILLFLSFGLIRLLEDFYYSQISSDLIESGHKLTSIINKEDDPTHLTNELTLLSEFLNAHIIIVDRDGTTQACDLMMGPPTGHFLTTAELAKVFAGESIIKRGFHHHHFEGPMLSVAIPVYEGDEVENVLMMFRPIAPITDTVNSMRGLIIYSAMAAIILASVVSYFLSKTLSKPLVQMNKVANEMAKGNFDNKMEVNSNDEVGLLGASLNNLSDQLKSKINELSHEKSKLEKVLASMSDGVITLDNKGNVILVNNQTEKLFQKENKDLELRGNFFKNPGFAELKELFSKVIESKSINQRDIGLTKKTISARMAPLIDNTTDEVIGVVGVLQDVTRERELEQMRRDFIANVSHELRTPLSLLQGYSEAIIDGVAEDTSEQDRYAKVIFQETLRLKRMVNELFDLSRLQTGNFTLEKTRISIASLLNTIQEKYKPAISKTGLRFETIIEKDLPDVDGDYDRLHQVMINLVENALNHTVEGQITLKAYTDSSKQIHVEVSDTGCGIPQGDLDLVWERFHKADKSRKRGKTGTGLGLAIVKSIIEAHGGNVWVSSQEGKGSTFGFSIPSK